MKHFFALVAFFCYATNILSQVVEDFSTANIGATYSSGKFTGNAGRVWTYTNARGNQQVTQNGNAAVSFNKAADACLSSDTIPYGITSLSFLYEQALSTNCEMLVVINNTCVDTITTSNEKGITKSYSLDTVINDSVTITLQQASASSGQITIDDIRITYARTPFIYTQIVQQETEVLLKFSNNLATASVSSVPEGAIETAIIQKDSVFVTLKQNLCGAYTMNVSDITDLNGESVSDTSFHFAFYTKPTTNQVVITEIMADPSPVVGLPEYEYIEIYNRSNCAIQCSDLQLIVGEKPYPLPAKILNPKEHLCLVSEKARLLFSDTLHCAFLQSFPSITNSGQTIALEYDTQTISSVTYSEQWYQDNFKADGGWALEKIDVDNFSESIENWRVAQNRVGGTPGSINSVASEHSDVNSPRIESLQVIDDKTISLRFSENIDCNSFIQNCSFSNDIQIDSIASLNHSLSQYILFTSQSLQSNQEYRLVLSEECADFSGNRFTENEYLFAKTDSVLQRNSIVINEILFNPVSNESDFVELYNNSDSYFDLSQVYLSDNEDFYQVTESFCLFPPHSYAVISPDAELYKQQSNCNGSLFISATLPSLPDDAGTILVFNRWEEVIDSLTYNAVWHSPYLADEEGVSLERMQFDLPSHEASSWFSAATSQGSATPGCVNSQSYELKKADTFRLESDVVTPDGDGENDEMLLWCNESERGTVCNVRVCSTNGLLVAQIADNLLLGTNDVIRWNCANAQGNLVPAGIYFIKIELITNGKKSFSEKKTCTILHE